MKSHFRVMLSVTVAGVFHTALLLNAGHSAATIVSSPASTSMLLNLSVIDVEANPISENVQEVTTQDSIITKQPKKNLTVVKETFKRRTNQPIFTAAKTTITKPQLVKTTVLPIKTTLRPTDSASVTVNNEQLIIQQPRFKTLPPAPDYPRRARQRGQQGVTLIHAKLNAMGNVTKIIIAKSSGYDLLDSAALKAVKTWDFMPNKHPINSPNIWVEVPVEFILNARKVS
ncbi:MAG: energy transducer TonB [Gammaproteobacteria bacterium]|nr:energy transducer TonB [Gammaproteobacteria bacterium]